MAEKILITGSAGLIGRELCKQLVGSFDVVSVDNNFRYPEYRPVGNFVRGDLIDYLKNTKNDFDYIFHMSAINGTDYFYQIPNKVIENNVQNDLAIFEFVKTNKKSKLIYASSSEVVSETTEFPTTECKDIYIENIHNPRWSYRLGKILSENYLMNSNINFLIVRFFNVYGPDSGRGHFIKDILDKIDREDYQIIGHDETRSFCRVEDAVDAVLNIFKKASNDIVNIGNSEEIIIEDAVNMISKHKNKNVNWNFVKSREGSVKRRVPCLDKLLSYYPNYKPKSFWESIKDL